MFIGRCFKFGADAVTSAFDKNIRHHAGIGNNANLFWALALFLNTLMQCFGSLMAAPLLNRYSIHRLLAVTTFLIAISVGALPIIELFLQLTGSETLRGKEDNFVGGTPKLFYLVLSMILYSLAGLFQGFIDLIRRIIPKNIVGSDGSRLKSFDSVVHVFYEASGTLGPIILYFVGMSVSQLYLLIPFSVLSLIAASCWLSMELVKPITVKIQPGVHKIGFFAEVGLAFQAFSSSIYQGAKLVFGNRSLIWLILAYSLPLVLHRYLENIMLAQYARLKHEKHHLRLAFVSSSNFGELLGAAFTLLFVNLVHTPLPWLRVDALTLFLTWVFYIVPQTLKNDPGYWGQVIGICILCAGISFGWASGDVSLLAYIQTTLGKLENARPSTSSPLGSVMSFLYVCYIGLFALVSIPLNLYMDYAEKEAGSDAQKIKETNAEAMKYSCIAFSALAIVIFLATFVPRNSFKFNPLTLNDKIGGEVDFEKASFDQVLKPLKPETTICDINDSNQSQDK